MSIFEWNNAYETGHSKVDNQHRHLADLLNQLAKAYLHGAPQHSLTHLLGELQQCARQHYRSEQRTTSQQSLLSQQRNRSEYQTFRQHLNKLNHHREQNWDSASPILDELANCLGTHLARQTQLAVTTATPHSAYQAIRLALKQSEEQLNLLINNLPNLLWFSFAAPNDTIYTRHWQQLHQGKPGLIQRHSWIKDIHPDDQAKWQENQRQSKQNQPFQVEYRLKDLQGNYHWLREIRTARLSSLGHLQAFSHYCTEISDEQQNLAALFELAEQNQALINSSRRLMEAQQLTHIGNWEWLASDKTLYWSDQVYALFQLDPANFQPNRHNLARIIHAQDLKMLRQAIHEALFTQQAFDVEHRILRADGSERTVRQCGIIQQDQQGHIQRIAGTIQDITDSKLEEMRLRQAAAIYENTMQGVMITDKAMHIIDINRAFTKITGYVLEEIVGQTAPILHAEQHEPNFYQTIWHSLLTTGHWQGEVWNHRKDGSVFPEWLTLTALYDDAGEVSHYIGLFSDISQIKKSETEMAQLAHYDSLSGLPNRLLFFSRLEHAIQTAKREHQRLAVLFIDLDNFKQINDTHGHNIGDDLLIELASRLKSCLRTNDTVCRLGGDEFTILLENQKVDHAVIDIAQKVVQACSQPFQFNQQQMNISCSVGISMYPRDGQDAEMLVRNADTAMYQAKANGKNCFHFYTKELTQRAILRMQMEKELRLALENQQLYLVLHPKYQLDSGELVGAEILLRWQHPTLGLISPVTFIPLAEETGQIIPIGNWVIQKACQLIRSWLDQELMPGHISLNIAGVQLHRTPINLILRQALQQYQIPADMIHLEVTENFIMHNPETHLKILNELHALGIRLSIDNFGTGSSSLSYLKQLPIQTLKIDQSLIRSLPNSENGAAISLAIISLAKNLKLELIAEGIESDEQRQFLIDAGCQYGQGYFYAKPMLVDEFVRLLQANKSTQSAPGRTG
ncbi:EAL domain-containing protein [Neisseriaceae bacterium TC5R-5]|nr:EAL domain-containing protein [Neisseriaceae bacterium TC5R-5]